MAKVRKLETRIQTFAVLLRYECPTDSRMLFVEEVTVVLDGTGCSCQEPCYCPSSAATVTINKCKGCGGKHEVTLAGGRE